MANEQNLMPIELVNARKTREERRKSASNAGKASGKAKRKRKAMKEQMEMLLSLPCNVQDRDGNELAEILSNMFKIDKNKIDNQMLMIASLWKTATNTNSSQQIQAIKEIREIVKDEQSSNEENRIQIINDLPKDDEDGTS